MVLEKRPMNPLPLGYRPAGGTPYQVKNGDNWENIAKKNGIKARDLVAFNFGTTNPQEVNWYLKNLVGCKEPAPDGFNYMFSSSAKPGIIYFPVTDDLPLEPIPLQPLPICPTPKITPKAGPPLLKKVWAGLGKAHSGDFFLIGAHDMTAKIYNLGDKLTDIRYAWLNINGWKFGPGLGGDIGAVFVLAYGFEEAAAMNGVDGGWDFDISLGVKLKGVLQGIKGLKIGKAVTTYEDYKKLSYLTENLIKNAGIYKPGIYTLPIPLAGWGPHLWAGYKFGDISILSKGNEDISLLTNAMAANNY